MATEKPQLIWHYTAKVHLENILQDGLLKVSEFEKQQRFKKPSLWFSANQEWEPTATKLAGDGLGGIRSLTKEEMHELFGLARISVKYSELKFNTWAAYKHISGLATSWLDNMEKVGIEKGGNPKEWFVTFNSIPENEWVNVQIWDGDEWVECEVIED